MFERFTDSARRAVVLAQEEARLLDHNYIGTEHLLLGLIHEGEGVAAKALASLGIGLDGVRAEVEGIIGRGRNAPSGHIPFTPRAKKAMELSLREALQLDHNYIGTEHLLLGLIRERDGVAAQVLVRSGADLNRVRQQVLNLLAGSNQEVPPADERADAEWGAVLASLRRLKESAIDQRDFTAAAGLRDIEKQLLALRSGRVPRSDRADPADDAVSPRAVPADDAVFIAAPRPRRLRQWQPRSRRLRRLRQWLPRRRLWRLPPSGS